MGSNTKRTRIRGMETKEVKVVLVVGSSDLNVAARAAKL